MLDLAGVEAGSPRARHRRRRGRPDDRGRAPRRRGGAVLATDISPSILELRGRRGAARRARQRRDAGDGRRGARRRAGLVRRRDLAARADVHAGQGRRRSQRRGGAPARRAATRRSCSRSPTATGFFSVPIGDHPPARASCRRPRPACRARSASRAPRRAARGGRLHRGRRAPRRGAPPHGVAAECTRFERESFGALHQMLAGLSEAERGGVGRDRGRAAASSRGRTASSARASCSSAQGRSTGATRAAPSAAR